MGAIIFLVEDNDEIREATAAYLEVAGHRVLQFSGTAEVPQAAKLRRPDLCILDVMLGDGNGFALAKKLLGEDPKAAFIFLTARESESDRITGFELGAEDYVLKPFSPRELVLRVAAVLRRLGIQDDEGDGEPVWELDGHTLQLREKSHEALLDGRDLRTTPVEWNILSFLVRNPGILITKERILGECLDYRHDGSERTVITHIKNLRAKLGEAPWIETLRGFGYKFQGNRKNP